jgi:hypothetical protein
MSENEPTNLDQLLKKKTNIPSLTYFIKVKSNTKCPLDDAILIEKIANNVGGGDLYKFQCDEKFIESLTMKVFFDSQFYNNILSIYSDDETSKNYYYSICHSSSNENDKSKNIA